MLIAKSSSRASLISSIVYSFGLLFLFSMSALYHRPHWEHKMRTLIQRLDHSAIFILIAGCFTPFCLLALTPEAGNRLLFTIWGAATLGVLQAIFWVNAPKWVLATIYITVGCLFVPYGAELQSAIGTEGLSLLVSGSVVYIIGALFYALKRPNLKPGIFGYHELFHVCTIFGAVLHFVVIYRLVN